MQKEATIHPLKLTGKNLAYAISIMDKLYALPRTGWVDRKIKNPETVGEHTDELVMWAEKYFKIDGLAEILRIHDWAESDPKVGDIRTDPNCPPERRMSKADKKALEMAAMKKIRAKLGADGQRIYDLWWEFEQKETERAKIANQLDKLQSIIKSIDYEVSQEFLQNLGPEITHPVLISLLQDKIILTVAKY